VGKQLFNGSESFYMINISPTVPLLLLFLGMIIVRRDLLRFDWRRIPRHVLKDRSNLTEYRRGCFWQRPVKPPSQDKDSFWGEELFFKFFNIIGEIGYLRFVHLFFLKFILK
jgi:hypothetical protein